MLKHLNDNLLNLVLEIITDDKYFKFIYIVTPYLNRVPSTGHIQCFSKFRMKNLFSHTYSLTFRPYRNYTEFLTIGKKKNK